MRRSVAVLSGLTLMGALLLGCSSTEAPPVAEPTTPAPSASEPEPTPTEEVDPVTVRIASLKGPTTMGLVGLMRDAATDGGLRDYEVTMYGTPDEVVPLVLQGDVDVALLPSNLAAVLYNKTLADGASQVSVMAINTLGVLEVLENGDTVTSMADLAGTTLLSTGKGASPEYMLNFLLTENGLDPAADLTVEYRSEPTELAAVLATTPGAVAVLPQPFATVVKTQNPAVRTALSLTDEWAKVAPDSAMVMGVVVVRTQFAAEHPEAIEDFLDDYALSTAFTNDNPAEAAVLIAEAGIVPAAPIAEAAIPACNITFIDGAELQTTLSGYLQVLFDADPASVGGALPGDDFYYER